ncbi:MAG: T9SS type A sorting domain-containing protein [Bacteroidia bacterium]
MKKAIFTFLFFFLTLSFSKGQFYFDWSKIISSGIQAAECRLISKDNHESYFIYSYYRNTSPANPGYWSVSKNKIVNNNLQIVAGLFGTGNFNYTYSNLYSLGNVLTDSQENIYLSGSYFGQVYLPNQTFTSNGYHIIKYDSSGNFISFISVFGLLNAIDANGNFYCSNGAIIFRYNSTFTLIDQTNYTGPLLKVFPNGEYVVNNNNVIKRYAYQGSILSQFGIPPVNFNSFKFSENFEYVALRYSLYNSSTSYFTVVDSVGNIFYTQTFINQYGNEQTNYDIDTIGNLYISSNSGISKYNSGMRLWYAVFTFAFDYVVDAGISNLIVIGKNIFYWGNYGWDFNNNYGQHMYSPVAFVPPDICKIKNSNSSYGIESFFGAIVQDTFPASGTNVSLTQIAIGNNAITKFCTTDDFIVKANITNYNYQLYPYRTLFIAEISDSTGSFANPVKIGESYFPTFNCAVPDSISQGGGYQVRVKTTNPALVSNPFPTIYSVVRSPVIDSLSIDNAFMSGYDIVGCDSVSLTVHCSDPNLTYKWVRRDLYGAYYDEFSLNDYDSIYSTSYSKYGVIARITNPVNQCYRNSALKNITVTTNPYVNIYFNELYCNSCYYLDTMNICVDNGPIRIAISPYDADSVEGFVSGDGVYPIGTSGQSFYFYPDSVFPGFHTIKYFFPFSTANCFIPADSITIFVDTCHHNIVTGNVANGSYLCSRDTVLVPFTINNTFDSTNVFKVLYGNVVIGTGTQSPIAAVIPDVNGTVSARFRVISTSPADTGTYNHDGIFYIRNISKPVITSNGVYASCFSLNSILTTSSSFGQGHYQWYFNNLLMLDSVSYNIVPYLADTTGNYKFNFIETQSSCSRSSDEVTVEDSTSVPYLQFIAQPDTNYFCLGDSLLLIAHTQLTNSVQWFKSNVPISGANDTLFYVSARGNYSCMVTSPAGCTLASSVKSIFENPIAQINVYTDSLRRCQGENFNLNAYSGTGYSYAWYKNGNPISGATSYSYAVTTDGMYKAFMTTPQGCSGFSDSAYIYFVPKPTVSIIPSTTVNACAGDSVLLQAIGDSTLSYQWYKSSSQINGATSMNYSAFTTGYYLVKVTDPVTYCSSSSGSVYINFHTPPEVTISPSTNVSFCIGDSAILSIPLTGNVTYQWTKDSIVIPNSNSNQLTVTLPGAYQAVASDVYGCSAVSSEVAVSTFPLPTAFIQANGPTTFCAGDSVLLTAQSVSGATYQWYRTGLIISSAIQNSYYAKLTGNYTVLITDTNGCYNISNIINVNVPCTPVSHNSGLKSEIPLDENNFYYSYFPNPVKDILYLNILSGKDGNAKIEIADCLGNTVFLSEVKILTGINETAFRIKNISAGTYFIKLFFSDEIFYAKLIKQ